MKKKSQLAELFQKIAKLLEDQAPRVQIFVALDPDEALTLQYANAMARVLQELSQEFRNELKHGDPDGKFKTPRDAVEYWQSRLRELLVEEDIPDAIA